MNLQIGILFCLIWNSHCVDFEQSIIVIKDANNTMHVQEALIGKVGCSSNNESIFNLAVQTLVKQVSLLVENVKEFREGIKELQYVKDNKSSSGIY